MKKYIAYGSNLNDEFMKTMGHDDQCLALGFVENSRLRFRGNGYLNLELDMGYDRVPVALWEIDEEVEKKLDEYEEYPTLYSKCDIQVKTDKGLVDAFAYIMNEPYSEKKAMPEKWYVDVVNKGYDSRGFDKSPFLEAIEEIGYKDELSD